MGRVGPMAISHGDVNLTRTSPAIPSHIGPGGVAGGGVGAADGHVVSERDHAYRQVPSLQRGLRAAENPGGGKLSGNWPLTSGRNNCHMPWP